MYNTKSQTSNRQGFENLIGIPSGYGVSYGFKLDSLIKPFTTQVNISGVPHYVQPLISIFSSGLVHAASATGLNPYGSNTIGEGLVWGTTMPGNLNIETPDPSSVRTQGLKNPLQMVGPGFDIFGYPTPNYTNTWDISGFLTPTLPSLAFKNIGETSGIKLSDVPYPFWKAGPLDLRWDQYRGVWTSPASVYSAKVVRANVTGAINPTTSCFAEDIRYDVMIEDGIANQMRITGVLHVGPKPRNSAYKVYTYASGDYCFLIHCSSGGKPQFGAWLVESPATEACDSSNDTAPLFTSDLYGGASDGEPWGTSKILTGSGLFHALEVYRVKASYGGTEKGAYDPNSILIGSGTFVTSKPFINGTGIRVEIMSTGILVEISGIAFISGGVNSNITEINGLTTPLSIGQGGTGSSTQNFIDLSTTQSASGLKSFANGVRLGSGTLQNPGISFVGNQNYGLFWASGAVGIGATGVLGALFGISGIFTNNTTFIYDNSNNLTTTPLTIRPGLNQTYALDVQGYTGSGIIGIHGSGLVYFGLLNHRTFLYPHSTATGNRNVYLPSSGQIASVHQVPVMYWNQNLSGVANGTNSGFILPTAPLHSGSVMLFKNGLLQRLGPDNDYTISSSGIYFTPSNVPNSGAILLATYQGTSNGIGGGAIP